MRLYHLLVICLTLALFHDCRSQQNPNNLSDSTAIKALLQTGRELSMTTPLKADSIGLVVFQQTTNAKWKGQAALIIAISNRHSNSKRCYAWSDSSMRYALISKDLGTAGVAARMHGVSAGELFKLEESLKYLLFAKQYLEQAKDTANLITSLITLSLLYHNDLKDYTFGKKYALESLALAEKSGIKNAMWFINNTVAINYDDNKEPEAALKYHYDNLKLRVDSSLYGETHNNIGNTLIKTGKTSEALAHFKTSYSIYKKYSAPPARNYDFATILNNISCAYAFFGNRNLMVAYRDSALHFAHESQNIEKLYDCYRDAYQNEERFGNYRQANIFLNQYLALKDSVYSSDKALAISDFEVQYETQKKESEIEILKASAQIKDLEVERARNLTLLIIAIVLILLIIAFLIIRKRAQQEKIKRLEEKEDFQRKQFAAVLEGEERERARIARELHDGVGQLLSITKLSLTGVRDEFNINNSLLNNAISSLDDATIEVRSVSHNLMPAALSTVGLEAALRDLIEKINRAGQVTVSLELSGLAQPMEKTMEIHIYRMIQEITNNILKHAHAKKINIAIAKEFNDLEIIVTDNGRRLDTNALENGTGIGWKNIMSRVAIMNGSVAVDSTEHSGTTLQIRLSA